MRLTRSLSPRPQDYRVVFVVGTNAADDDLAAADLLTARAAVSAEDSGLIDISAVMASVGSATQDRRYWWLGVPDDAPDIASAINADSDHFASMEAYPGGPQYDAVDYKWWRGQRGWTSSQKDSINVIQGVY